MSNKQGRVIHVDPYDHWKYEWHAREKHMPADSPPHRYNVYISTDGDLPEHPDWDVEQLASRNGYEGLFLTDEPIDTKDKALAFFKEHGHKILGSKISVTIQEHEVVVVTEFNKHTWLAELEADPDKYSRYKGYSFDFTVAEFCKLLLGCVDKASQAENTD